MLYVLFGFFIGTFIFEPIVINFIYFMNIDLFCDIILTKKNYCKLKKHFEERNNNL